MVECKEIGDDLDVNCDDGCLRIMREVYTR